MIEGVTVHQGWSKRCPSVKSYITMQYTCKLACATCYIQADYVGDVEIITSHCTILAAYFAPYPLRTSIAKSPRVVLVRMRSNGPNIAGGAYTGSRPVVYGAIK